MSDAGARLARPLAPRARALPWLSVAAGSLVTAIVPVVAPVPLLPPCGLLMLLGWRLLSRYSLRRWAAAPLGLLDDLVSGQPLGSAVLLWSLVFLGLELADQRMPVRHFAFDWLVAAVAIVFCLGAGRLLALPRSAAVDTAVAAQAAVTVLLFPLATRLAAAIDARGSPR